MVKFDHMNLPVSDPKASRDWYVRNFGFTVEFEVPERNTIAIKDDADFTIFLYPPQESIAGAKCGLTFQVSDVDAKYRDCARAASTSSTLPASISGAMVPNSGIRIATC